MANENEKLAAERVKAEAEKSESARKAAEEAQGKRPKAGVVVGLKAPHKLLISHEGREVVLNGSVTPHPADTLAPGTYRHEVVGGYGLTPDVHPDLIEGWLKTHAQGPFVQNDLIFAETSIERARKRAAEQVATRSGMEPSPQETADTKPLDKDD